MPIIYDSKAIIPAPFVSIVKENILGEDGRTLSHTYNISVKGKLCAEKGSPNASGVFWTAGGYPPDEVVVADSRLGSLLRKQEGLIKLFATEGKLFEISPLDGAAPLSFNPRVRRIDFQEGKWFDTVDYVITLEADWITGLAYDEAPLADKISRATDEWNIELLDEKASTYRLTHSVSAIGKRVYDETGALLDSKEAWENAKDYVLGTLGLGINATRMQAPDVLDASTLQAFNYVRNNAINERSGSFSVTESWVCYDPAAEAPAIHDDTVNTRFSIQDNKTTVSIDGNITGFEVRDNNTHALVSVRWTNANSKWTTNVLPNLYNLASSIAGLTLNSASLSNSVGLNQAAGTVQYHYEFDNRPSSSVSGSINENITINNNHAADVFAQVPVLGRPYGPVLQSMSTVTAKKRTISIEVQMAASTQSFTASAPNTDAIVLSLAPVSALGVFLEHDEESWTANTGRYSRNVSFVWE